MYTFFLKYVSLDAGIVPTWRPTIGAQHSPKLCSSDLCAFFGNSRPSSRGATKNDPKEWRWSVSMPGSGRMIFGVVIELI